MMEVLERFVSVIVPIRNVENSIELELRSLSSYLCDNFTDHEILLVDHRSSDSTICVLNTLLSEIPFVRCIQLSTSVDVDTAFAAGMESAIGDHIVLFVAGIDEPGSIRPAVELNMAGSHIVVGVAKQKVTLGYFLARPFIILLLNIIGYDLPRNATTFRCLTRKVVNAATETGRFHHQLFVRISRTGYSSQALNCEVRMFARRTFWSGLKQAVNLLVFNSTAPLRWMSVVGAVGSFFSLSFAFYSIIIRLFKDDVIEGWTSLAFVISFLFMLLFTILAFFGEYLGRLLDDRSEHREYSIADEINSSIVVNSERLNVSD